MRIKFWGSRGSLPSPTKHKDVVDLFQKLITQAKKFGMKDLDDFSSAIKEGRFGHPLSFGGNTTCIEVADSNQAVFIDMGSGLREAGTYHTSQGRKEFSIFLTHMHWDHIMGLPFFIPVYVPGAKITIYHVHDNTPEFVKINFNGVNFPLKFEQLSSKIEFKKLDVHKSIQLENFKITPLQLDHPGQAFGYRFESKDEALTVGIDSEYKRLTDESLKDDLPSYQKLDLLVFDGQYEMAELANKFDWGHCSPSIGVDLALREGIRNIVMAHHDPWADYQKLKTMHEKTQKYLEAQLPAYKNVWDRIDKNGPKVYFAYDGLEIDLAK